MLELIKSILNYEDKVQPGDALPLISTFCESIGKVAPVLFKPFAFEFIPTLIEDSKKAFFSANAKMLRNTKKEFVDQFIEHIFKGLMDRLAEANDKQSQT